MPQYPQLSFTGGELSPHVHARIDIARYDVGARRLRNFMVHEYGGVSNRPGTMFIGEARYHDHASRLIPFAFNTTQTYVLEFSHLKMRILKDGGFVAYPVGHPNAGDIVEITSPYASTDLGLVKFAQSADILTLCHPSYQVYELSRSDHHVWTFQAVTFTPSIATPASPAVTAYGSGSGTNYKYIVTAVAANGEESLATSPVSCVNRYDMNAGTSYYNQVSWSAVTGAVKYNVYRYDDYDGYTYGFISSVVGTQFNDNGSIDPDVTDAPPESRTPFNGANKYPSCCAYYKQRLCFGRSNTLPQTLWMTQTSNYRNMNVSSPRRADDAIEYTLAGNMVNDIRHIIPLRDLIILTSGGEWAMSSGSEGVAAETVSFTHESVNGSSHIQPLVINNSVLYASPGGKKVRDLFYRFEDDGYSGDDLTVFSRHLLENRSIVEWAFQREPFRIIWVVCDDGTLLGLTYNREQQVWGWHRHDTLGGAFESVCVIEEDGIDKVYVVVRRTIGETEKRYVEVMHSRQFDDVADAVFMDSALSYSGSAVATLSGLSHLEGHEVAVLADGNVHARCVVTDGEITLNYAAAKIHVGLPIVAELETLDVHFPSVPSFGQQRNVHMVTLYIKDTRGLWIGPDAAHLTEHKQRSQNQGYGAIPLQNGEIKLPITPDWNANGRIFICQKDPLPATILSAVPEVSYGTE